MNTFHNADRSITITVDDSGVLTDVTLQGSLSAGRLSADISRLHHQSHHDVQTTPHPRANLDNVIESLATPPNDTMAAVFESLRTALTTLTAATQHYREHQSIGENDAYRVTISCQGTVTDVTPKDGARQLPPESRGVYIVHAYQQALAEMSVLADHIEQQLENLLGNNPAGRLQRV